MLEVGQIFNRNGFEYTILDFIDFEDNKYVLCSKEKDKIAYVFYKISYTETGFNFAEVKDEQLNFNLLEIVERNSMQ